MRRLGILLAIPLLIAPPLDARHETQSCATTQDTAAEVLFLHRQSARSRPLPRTAAPSNNRDIGNLAIIEATPGVVETLNQFTLDGRTLTLSPTTAPATTYRYAVSGLGYDGAAASQGSPVVALGDDDSRRLALPFAFPFYGAAYREIYLNSDGNLTFTAGDSASSGRSVGRMTGGVPRISPLFDDLDPSQPGAGVRYFADSSHVVFTWVNVPEYSQYGAGGAVTFQARLYVDGRIQFSYNGINGTQGPASAVIGIAPGGGRNGTAFVSYLDPATDQSGAIVERFGNTQDVDVVSVAQKFYETHEDAYDYLVIYNNLDIPAGPSAVAYESTVRSSGTGYGVAPTDHGSDYGSPARLRSVLNLGMLSNYPVDPNGIVPLRAPSLDTPLTVLGHEAGHLFLAFAGVPDPANATAQPMIGFGGAHWSFVFNSEASLDEGEKITDRGAGASPRFATSAVTQGYSPLDRYMMGFGPASDVPPTFYVKDYDPRYVSPISHPVNNVSFDGIPVPVTVADIAQALGRRTPDYTVAQHRFRFGFILIVAPGSLDAQLARAVQAIDNYRQIFPNAYGQYAANLATAETTFNRRMSLSLFPASGIVAGASSTASLTVSTAPKTDLTINLVARNGFTQVPATVTIPAGATRVSFPVSGLKSGVEELTAAPSDASYETAFARIQIATASQLTLRAFSPSVGGTFVSLTDVNGLVYSGARITATTSDGGTVTPTLLITDSAGQAGFQWDPGSAALSTLTFAVESAPAVTLRLNAGPAAPALSGVSNSASFVQAMAAGAIESLFGAHLGDASVSLNGVTLQQFYRGDSQINFYVPEESAPGAGTLTVTNAAGIAATLQVTVTATDPGIFPGAIVHAGTSVSADTTPVKAGDYIEIYCTGLGATHVSASGLHLTNVTPTVYIGSTPLQPAYSGLAPGFAGLYQVDVQIPAGLPPGEISVVLTSGPTHSNEAKITVQ